MRMVMRAFLFRLEGLHEPPGLDFAPVRDLTVIPPSVTQPHLVQVNSIFCGLVLTVTVFCLLSSVQVKCDAME